MQEHKIIVDTSVWIEYLKNNETYVPLIEDNLNLENIIITGVIISELLHGVKNQNEFLLLSKSISAIPYVECKYEDWIKTGEILFELKKKGNSVPLTDVLISAIALRNNALVLTKDKHFNNISQIKLMDIHEES